MTKWIFISIIILSSIGLVIAIKNRINLFKDIKITDFIVAFTAVLIMIFTYQQMTISSQLANITKLQEESKFITSKKELRNLCFKILNLFSTRGIDERAKHSKEANLELAKNFSSLLQDGFDNYLLISDKESLSHWVNAMSALDIYSLDKDILKPYALVSEKEVKEGVEWTDKDFNEMCIGHMSSALTEVMQVYGKLGLDLSEFKKKKTSPAIKTISK